MKSGLVSVVEYVVVGRFLVVIVVGCPIVGFGHVVCIVESGRLFPVVACMRGTAYRSLYCSCDGLPEVGAICG